MTINNTKDKKIETYNLTAYEKNNQILLYQYLVSNDAAFDVEEVLFKDLISNTF